MFEVSTIDMNYHENMSLYSAFLGLIRSFVELKFCFLICRSIVFIGTRYNLINLLKHTKTYSDFSAD